MLASSPSSEISSFNAKDVEMSKPESPEDAQQYEPDGGVAGWTAVAGAWLILFSTFGYVYAFGVYQGLLLFHFSAAEAYLAPLNYYTRAFLTSHTPSSIAWIGSFQLMMPFALGLVSGKLFDMGYFHPPVAVGSALFTFSLFMLSLAQQDQYYQVFLSQGLGMGIGIGLAFVPTMSVTVHHFKRRRALASGVVLSGSSAGALVFPIMLNHLIPSKGFAEGVRATAYIVLGCLIIGNLLVKMPKKRIAHRDPPDIKSFFKEPAYLTVLAAALFVYFGLFYPLFYLQLYAVEHNVDPQLAFYSLSIVNGSSLIGRILGNFLADTYGGWNLQVPCTLVTAAAVWAVLGIHNATTLIIVSILYGISSGALLSLSFAILADLAVTPNEVGARTGLALGVASLGCLFSAPIQGALLTREFHWIKPTSFAGSLLLVGAFFCAAARRLVAQKRGTQRV